MDSETRAEFAKLHQRLDAIESALTVRSGPYAGVKPGPAPVVDPAKLAAAKALLAGLGQYAPGDSLLARWLVRYTPEEISAAIGSLIGPMPGDDAETDAYYFSVKQHSNGGWKQVFPELAGEDEGPIVSPDKESNLLAGLSKDAPEEAWDRVAEQALERAERGVDWRGQVALNAEELAEAKAILADPGRWHPSWSAYLSTALLRLKVLTNVIPRKWEGANALMSYPSQPNDIDLSPKEWLKNQRFAEFPEEQP